MSRYTRPSWAQRVPIAEAAVTGSDGYVYAARMYPEWTGNYDGSVPLTEYFFRRGNEWVAVGWTSIPKAAYRQLRARLKVSKAATRGRVATHDLRRTRWT